MTTRMGYHWLLRERMAEHGLWKTTDLGPLLAERGVHLSAAQIYRLVVQAPERLSMPVLAALCDILGCGPGDLIDCYVITPAKRRAVGAEDLGDTKLRDIASPRRARVDPGQPSP